MQTEYVPERALWCAVLLQAFEDACGVVGGSNRTRLERDQARSWLLSDTRDFFQVSSLAGLEPLAVREEAVKLERAGWPERRRPPERKTRSRRR